MFAPAVSIFFTCNTKLFVNPPITDRKFKLYKSLLLSKEKKKKKSNFVQKHLQFTARNGKSISDDTPR